MSQGNSNVRPQIPSMSAEESFRMLSIGAVAFSALSVLFGKFLIFRGVWAFN